MTAPRPGNAFHLDLDGTVIAGRYIEVDPPHRMVIGWDRHGTDKSTPTPALGPAYKQLDRSESHRR